MKKMENVIKDVFEEVKGFEKLDIDVLEDKNTYIFKPLPNFKGIDGIKVLCYEDNIQSVRDRKITLSLPAKDNYNLELEANISFVVLSMTLFVDLTVHLKSMLDQKNIHDVTNKHLYACISKKESLNFIINDVDIKDRKQMEMTVLSSISKSFKRNEYIKDMDDSLLDLFIKLVKENILSVYQKDKKRPGVIDELMTDHFGNFTPIQLKDWKPIEGEHKGLKYKVVPRSYDDVWIYYLCGYIYIPHKVIKNHSLIDFWDDFNEEGLDVDYMVAENENGTTIYKVGFTTDHFGYTMEKYTPELTESVCQKLVDFTLDKIKESEEK